MIGILKKRTDLRQNILIYLTLSWVLIESVSLFINRYKLNPVYFDFIVGLTISGFVFLLGYTWLNVSREKKGKIANGQIGILIVDDHKMIRDVIKSYLESPGFKVLGEAANGVQALEFLKRNRVDILLTDIDMPEMNGVKLAMEVTKQYPKVRVISISMVNDQERIKEMVKAGAVGYLIKDDQEETVREAVQVVHQGGKYFSPSVAKTVFDSLSPSPPES